jgi:hypothetical protein
MGSGIAASIVAASIVGASGAAASSGAPLTQKPSRQVKRPGHSPLDPQVGSSNVGE